MTKTPKIVIVGGGTGSYVVASGLRDMSVDISLIVTMVDDGGSNKVIRDEFGLLPTSGIRQGIVALSKNQSFLRKLFTYRYHQGGPGLKGMTFGNLFMAAMADLTGSQIEGIKQTCQLLQVKGRIIPASYDDVRLVADYEDGSQVKGEHAIDEPLHQKPKKIINLSTKPQARISTEAKQAILEADLIIFGPGDFYTNTIANLIVKGMTDALDQSRGKLVLITNLMTKFSETPDYKLSDFLTDFDQYYPKEAIDYLLINNNQSYPLEILKVYKKENSEPVKDDLPNKTSVNNEDDLAQTKLIRKDLLSSQIAKKQKGDTVSRSMIRHDPTKLAQELVKLTGNNQN
ncbi:MAG: uridine diphosphate-N-acetylglucosamine-binding protein YvcK [Candidatus Pacebacteria bacterium]|nr:uridine diphosphate-N-acetylglucosamine-binding protein YvcK [Candidatus Paceibacterota bacterium]